MVQYLENLANELLLDIFEYFPAVDLLRAFYNLNHRLNHLLFIHFQSFSLDFRSVSQDDFHHICSEYLPTITDHIKSLCLSNNDDTPQQIDVFYKHNLTIHQFHFLQSLSLYDLCSNELMNTIISECKYLPNLTHLIFAGCYLKFNQIQTEELINNIWNLPKLIDCYLNIHFGEYNIFIPTIQSLSLKYLFIWGTDHSPNEINALLKQTPNLQHFSIILNDNDDIQQVPSLITKLNLCLSRIEENLLIKFFENMVHLNHLIIDICSSTDEIFNGYQWENLIRNYLPNLQRFRFRTEFLLNEIINCDEQINNLLNSFKNSFWIKEHHWFIRCHWHSFSNLAYLYSLPYTFKDFRFNSSMQFKSTCPDEKNYFNYNYVNELKYDNSSIENLILCPIRFSNIKQLSISFPIDKNFWSIIPKLDHITSLDISMNDHNDTPSQLQNLIEQIPRLYSLNVTSCLSFTPIFELKNSSIRRLDLRGYQQFLNDKQCQILSHSLLGIQCEILFINIQNRSIITDLIKNMINLRTLNIQCKDDQFNEIEQDKLISWLKSQLPSTCIISRDLVFRRDIRIWIR